MKFKISTTHYWLQTEEGFTKYKSILRKYNFTKIKTEGCFEFYVEINSIEELMDLVNGIDEKIIIFPYTYCNNNENEIEIYNTYRE